MAKIIQNAIKTPDGTVIRSLYRHHNVSHKGHFIDGGMDYVRIGGTVDYEDLIILSTDSFEKMCLKMVVNVSIEGDKLIWKKLVDCDEKEISVALKNLNLLPSQGYTVCLAKAAIHFLSCMKVEKYTFQP